MHHMLLYCREMRTRRLSFFLAPILLAAIPGCLFVNQPPEISFSLELLTAASVSVVAPEGWVHYEWHFGDGSTAEGPRVEHAYEEPGEYTIDLKAISVDGVAAFDHQVVFVHRDIRVIASRALPPEYLQDVVDEAEAGDMLLIEGEFVGNTVIDEPITLRGPCTLISAGAGPALLITGDGVTLEEIAFEGSGDEATAGGALRLMSAAIRAIDCSFEGHSGFSGAAICMIESRSVFTDCTFSDNHADVDGGAVYCEGDEAFPTFRSCKFLENTADAGGAIAVRATTHVSLDAVPLRVEDCVFEQNRATAAEAGGAVHVGHTCRLSLEGCTFTSNGLQDVVYE